MRRPLLFVLLAVLAGCRGPSATSAHSVSPARAAALVPTGEASTLGAGDQLEVRVFDEPDLSGAYRIGAEGTLDFPLCGKVPVAGLTQSGVADTLTRCLAHGYLKHPNVTVLVKEYNSKKVFVFGEVQKPGTFPFEDNMSVIQAITLAGGFTKTASKNNTNVTRTVQGKEVKIRVPVEDIGEGREKNFILQPGDIIVVPESFF